MPRETHRESAPDSRQDRPKSLASVFGNSIARLRCTSSMSTVPGGSFCARLAASATENRWCSSSTSTTCGNRVLADHQSDLGLMSHQAAACPGLCVQVRRHVNASHSMCFRCALCALSHLGAEHFAHFDHAGCGGRDRQSWLEDRLRVGVLHAERRAHAKWHSMHSMFDHRSAEARQLRV